MENGHTRCCARCNTVKHVDEFGMRSNRRYYRSHCRSCSAELSKIYYAKNGRNLINSLQSRRKARRKFDARQLEKRGLKTRTFECRAPDKTVLTKKSRRYVFTHAILQKNEAGVWYISNAAISGDLAYRRLLTITRTQLKLRAIIVEMTEVVQLSSITSGRLDHAVHTWFS